MVTMKRSAVLVMTLMGTGSVLAQPGQPDPGEPSTPPTPPPPVSTLDPSASLTPPPTPPADQAQPKPPPDAAKQKKEPGRGDFDAGGQVRFPNGPDEAGEYAAFNWVAFDIKGRYFLLDSVTVNGNFPLAVKKPDMLMGPMGAPGADPRTIGGGTIRLDAKGAVPRMPGVKLDTEAGISLTAGYMREGAMLLSEKDYPLFVGDMKLGFAAALITKVKLSSVVDFSLIPAWVYQQGTMESLTAVQIPMSTIIKVGELVKVSVDLGIYTGDDYTFRGSKGGRLAFGGALDVKLGPILLHAGTGVASLLTGQPAGGVTYPSIRESVYVDLNVKYAK